jgi:cobalt-zinc-cadmium efflux system protein
MHVWEITSNMYSFTAHISINTGDYRKTKEILDKITGLLRQKYSIEHTTIQFELSS